MLNDFKVDGAEARVVDLYPPASAAAIDATNAWTYEMINNGVYRCGFATQQRAYEAAEKDVHAGMRRADEALAASRFLCGDVVSEADVRLLPTIVRFDGVCVRAAHRPLSRAYTHRTRRAMLARSHAACCALYESSTDGAAAGTPPSSAADASRCAPTTPTSSAGARTCCG